MGIDTNILVSVHTGGVKPAVVVVDHFGAQAESVDAGEVATGGRYGGAGGCDTGRLLHDKIRNAMIRTRIILYLVNRAIAVPRRMSSTPAKQGDCSSFRTYGLEY